MDKPFVVFGTGTTMLEHLRYVKALKIPSFADAYDDILNLVPKQCRELLFLKRLGGCGALAGNYKAQAPVLDRLYDEHGPLHFIDHSQPTILDTLWMIRNPKKVASKTNIAAVFEGTESWVRELGERLRIPCATDFKPGSTFLLAFAEEYEEFRKKSERPHQFNVAPKADYVATPLQTCLLPTDHYTHNYIFSKNEPDKCHDAIWVPTRHDLGHFNILKSGKLRWLILEVLAGRVPDPGPAVMPTLVQPSSHQQIPVAA